MNAYGMQSGGSGMPPVPQNIFAFDAPFPTPTPAISNPAPDFRRPCLDQLFTPIPDTDIQVVGTYSSS